MSWLSLCLCTFSWAKGHICNLALQMASLAGFNQAFRIRRSSKTNSRAVLLHGLTYISCSGESVCKLEL